MKQYLKLKLSQKLSPQQIQLMKLIQLPTLDFEQKIQREIEENPALEIEKNSENEKSDDLNIDDYISDDDTPFYKTSSNNYSSSEQKSIPYSSGISFTEYLISQLKTISLDENDMKIAEFLVGSIDDAGYLRLANDEIIDDLAFTQNINTDENKVLKILKIIQTFDPPGVGAKSLQSCIAIQLKRKESTNTTNLAIEIIENSFDQFSKKHYQKLLNKYSISEYELKEVVSLISKLNPKPGGAYSGLNKPIEQVIPDFKISIENNELSCLLYTSPSPRDR